MAFPCSEHDTQNVNSHVNSSTLSDFSLKARWSMSSPPSQNLATVFLFPPLHLASTRGRRSFTHQVVADDLMRVQLNTMDEERVVAFESDPCAMAERYAAVQFNGANYHRYAKSFLG